MARPLGRARVAPTSVWWIMVPAASASCTKGRGRLVALAQKIEQVLCGSRGIALGRDQQAVVPLRPARGLEGRERSFLLDVEHLVEGPRGPFVLLDGQRSHRDHLGDMRMMERAARVTVAISARCRPPSRGPEFVVRDRSARGLARRGRVSARRVSRGRPAEPSVRSTRIARTQCMRNFRSSCVRSSTKSGQAAPGAHFAPE